MALYQGIADRYLYGNKYLKLDLSYGNVLKILDLQREEIFTDEDKIILNLKILVKNYRVIRNLPIKEKQNVLQCIYNEFISGKKKSSGNDKKIFDFSEDEEYIYASFMSCYGIDLYEIAYKLPWKKFMALFNGLSDDTKIKEIMSIRARKVPAPTKYNQEEIKNLLELKAYYAFGNTEENFQDGLNALWGTLERMAKK